MIHLGNLARDMMVEEDQLRDKVLPAFHDEQTSRGELAILDCLLAIHKRQRDGIILGMRTSNG